MDILDLNIRITAAARFDTDASVGGKPLKAALQQQSGQDPRRFSRLSLLAALGANLLKPIRPVAPDCAVYTAAPFSSPSVFEKMTDNVLNHAAAMPFDFIANLHNAPSFHAAQMLGSSGATVFVPADNRPNRQFYPLLAAALSLHAGGCRLVLRTPRRLPLHPRRQRLAAAGTRRNNGRGGARQTARCARPAGKAACRCLLLARRMRLAERAA